MSLYRRKDSPFWWVKLSHNGRTLQRSTGTAERRKAKEYHDKLKAELWEVERLGVKPGHTWDEAVLRWLDEKSHKATLRNDKTNFRWLQPHLTGMRLSDIDRDLVDKLTRLRQTEANGARGREGEAVTAATVNRMLLLLRSVLKIAVDEWDWIDKTPKVRLLKEPDRRIRFLTEDEAARLLRELPEHLRAVAWFSLLTGLRKSNVRRLSWSQVNLDERIAWIHPDQAKARKAIAVPLSEAAVKLLKAQEGKHPEYCFTYNGQPLACVTSSTWYKALERAGIADFRWHDLRHTWASWHIQGGTPLFVLQEMGGWTTTDMVRRYAHLTPGHLSTHADRFASQIGAKINSSNDSATQPPAGSVNHSVAA
jgi:integrase